MSEFCLFNADSINLNFIIYIQNLYKNQIETNTPQIKFPWFPLEKDSLLANNEFESKLEKLWSLIFNYDNLYEVINDLEYWNEDIFEFNNLFKYNSIGVKTYSIVKKSYESWYWGSGNHMLNKFSNQLVEKYYNNLISVAKLKNFMLKDMKFCLQTIYDIPSVNVQLKNKNMIIISSRSNLPTIEDLLPICCYT